MKTSLLAFVLVTCGLALLMWLRPRSEHPVEGRVHSDPGILEAHDPEPASETKQEDHSADSTPPAIAERRARRGVVSGILLPIGAHLVEARVALVDGRSVTPDPGSGSFFIEVDEQARKVEITAPGFRPLSVGLPAFSAAMSLGEIELLPLEPLTMTVTAQLSRGDDSIEGAYVMVLGSERGTTRVTETPHGPSGTDGQVAFSCRPGDRVFAYGESLASYPVEVARGESRIRLPLLPKASIQMETLPRTGILSEPYELLLALPGVAHSLHREIRSSGFPRPVPLGGMILRSARSEVEIVAAGPGRPREVGEWEVELDSEAPTRITLGRAAVPKLQLRDAVSHEPILEARIWVEGLYGNGWTQVAGHTESEVSADGVFSSITLHRLLSSAERVPIRLHVFAEGYELLTLRDPGIELEGVSPIVLDMSRQAGAGLRVLTAPEGEPYPHRLHIYVEGIPLPVFQAVPAADGIVPGIPLEAGKEVRVSTGPYERAFAVTVAYSEREKEAPGSCDVAIPTGHIRAENAPDGFEPACLSQGGEHFLAVRDESDWFFEDVPIGRFAVGSPEVLQAAGFVESQGGDAYPVLVFEGQTSSVDLSGQQSGTEQQRGELSCRGVDPTNLYVVPEHVSPELPVSTRDSRVGAFDVDASGTYLFGPLATAPTRLAVFYRRDDGAEVPVAVTRGEPTQVNCGALEVEVTSLPGTETDYWILWSPRVPGLSGGPLSSTGQVQESGTLGETLTIRSIPVLTSQVILVSNSLYEVVSVNLVAGGTARKRLSYE